MKNTFSVYSSNVYRDRLGLEKKKAKGSTSNDVHEALQLTHILPGQCPFATISPNQTVLPRKNDTNQSNDVHLIGHKNLAFPSMSANFLGYKKGTTGKQASILRTVKSDANVWCGPFVWFWRKAGKKRRLRSVQIAIIDDD